jgi:hypothetical protein
LHHHPHVQARRQGAVVSTLPWSIRNEHRRMLERAKLSKVVVVVTNSGI